MYQYKDGTDFSGIKCFYSISYSNLERLSFDSNRPIIQDIKKLESRVNWI